jgi:hypothetical protein
MRSRKLFATLAASGALMGGVAMHVATSGAATTAKRSPATHVMLTYAAKQATKPKGSCPNMGGSSSSPAASYSAQM